MGSVLNSCSMTYQKVVTYVPVRFLNKPCSYIYQGEMVQSVRCPLYKHEDLSRNIRNTPPHTHKKKPQQILIWAQWHYNSTQSAETSWSLDLLSRRLMNAGFKKRPCIKRRGGEQKWKILLVFYLQPPCGHSTHICAHTETHTETCNTWANSPCKVWIFSGSSSVSQGDNF